MSCQVFRTAGQISRVEAPNGKESILYQSALGLPEVKGDREVALQSWAQAYTPSFKKWFGESKSVDENGEPDISEVLSYDEGNPSVETSKSILDGVEGKMINYVKELGFYVQTFDDLKEMTGHNTVSATDLINKVVIFGKNADFTSIAKETAYVAYALLGKKNKITTDLKHSITEIDNYAQIFEQYKARSPKLGDYKIKELIIIDFIADAIKINSEVPRDSYINRKSAYWGIKGSSALEKRLKYYLTVLMQSLTSLFTDGKLSRVEITDIIDDIANDILTGNFQKLQKELQPEQQLTNFKEAIESDPFAKSIVENFKKLGIILTGSLALRKQGTVFRSSKETLHDLDFTVPNHLVSTELREAIAELNFYKDQLGIKRGNSVDRKFAKVLQENMANFPFFQEILKLHPDLVIKNAISSKGQVSLLCEIGTYAIDLFIKTDEHSDFNSGESGIQDWQLIMAAKVAMGRAKDMLDFIHFKPFNIVGGRFAQIPGLRHFTFNKVNPVTELRESVKQEKSKLSQQELATKIQAFLEKIGVSITVMDSIKDASGNPISALAKADMLNRIIEVMEGQAGADTLPEEAAHFFVELLPEGSPLLKEMMSTITSYDIYKQVVEQYKNDPEYRNADKSVNFTKLKKEAIGRVIATHVFGQSNEQETDERVKKANSWFKKLWDYIVGIFDKTTDNPFAEVAAQILAGETAELDTDKSIEGIYYHLDESVDKLKADQGKIVLDNSIDKITGQKKHIYTYNGVQTKGSVTSVKVQAHLKKTFSTDRRTTLQKEIDLLKAGHGDNIHLDAQNIVLAYIDPKTGLKRGSKFTNGQVVTNAAVYAKLDTYISDLINSYPAGTQFYTEFKIFDPKQNLAGSIDLLAIAPDGTVDIYDWKSQEIKAGATELKDYKPEVYRIQLQEYKNILESNYGFKKFNRARAIPIRTLFDYSKNPKGDLFDIEIGNFDSKLVASDKNYLLPVGLREEQSGDERIDALVAKLYRLLDIVSQHKLTGNEREAQQHEIAKINLAIRSAQLKKDATDYINLGTLEMHKYQKKIRNNSFTSSEIMEASTFVESIFINSASYLENFRRDIETKLLTATGPEKIKLDKLKADIAALNANASILKEDLRQQMLHMGVQLAELQGIKNLLTPEKELGIITRNFLSISNLQTRALNTFYLLIRRQNDLRDIKITTLNEELGKLQADLKVWGAKKGLLGNKMFEGMLEFDEHGRFAGRLLSQVQAKFYKDRDAAIVKDDVAWMLANTTFDKALYDADLKKQAALYASITYSTDPAVNKQEQDKKLESWKQHYNIYWANGTVNKQALFNIKSRFIKANTSWSSSKWLELNKPENAPLKDFYLYTQDMLKESERMGMIDGHSKTFMPAIRKSNLEKVVFGDAAWYSGIGPGFFEKLEVGNEKFSPEVDALNGSEVRSIPIYFKKDLGVEVTNADGSVSKDYSAMSTDMVEVFRSWGVHMYTYNAMQEIEDDANLLLKVEQMKDSIVENDFGFVKMDGDKPKTKKNNIINAEILEEFVNHYVYQRQNGGTADRVITVRGKKYSLSKGFKATIALASFTKLGLNVLSGTSQFVGGAGNAYLQAAKGQHFTEAQWFKSNSLFASRDPKAAGIYHFFETFLEDARRDPSKSLSMSEAMKHGSYDSVVDKSFVIQKTMDKAVQYPIAIAMALSHMVDDNGKIVSIRDFVKENHKYNETFYSKPVAEREALAKVMAAEEKVLSDTKSVYALSSITNGVFAIKGINRSDETCTAFRNNIRKVSKNVIGNATADDISKIRTTIIGTGMLQYRNWIAQMALDRGGNLRRDLDTGQLAQGRVAVFFGEVYHKRGLAAVGTLIAGFGENGLKSAKARYQEEKIKAASAGREFTATEGEYIEMYKGAMRAQMRELMLLLSFYTLTFLGKPGDDDDKDYAGLKKFMSRGLNKYYNEFAFFYDITEFGKIVGNSLPVLGVLNDLKNFISNTNSQLFGYATDDEARMKKAHPAKYLMRMVPIVNSLSLVMAALDDDFRKANDIKL